jgi:2-dehydro-3-deoxy-D-gluconate 5-dehydrogenase
MLRSSSPPESLKLAHLNQLALIGKPRFTLGKKMRRGLHRRAGRANAGQIGRVELSMGQVPGIFDVSGRVALVTGGSSGLGLQIVRALVRAGAKVISAARTHDMTIVDDVMALAAPENTPQFVYADVTSQSDIERAFDSAEAAHGLVTILFNNAGVTEKKRASEIDRESWREIMAVNVDGQFFVAQEAARRMMAAKSGGSIINTTSILAESLLRGTAAYATSKAAVAQMTRALALEWAAHGIRVNAIAPGWFPTRMNQEFLDSPGGDFIRGQNPMRRFGEAGDLDGVVLLLASDASRYMTGSVLTVDGGHSLIS